MATRYDEILRRDRRRASGMPLDEDEEAPRSRYDAILSRDAERQERAAAEQQAAQISRARTITRPNTTAPADATARGLDPAAPGGSSGFRGAGGGYDEWDDGTGFGRNLGRYAADAAGPGFVQSMGATMRTVGDVLPETQSFVGARELLERGGRAVEDYGLARRAPAPRVQSLADALDSGANARDYLGSTLGQGLGSSVPSIAGAVVGGIPGAVAGAYTQQVGEVRGEFDQIAPEMDPRTRALGSLGLAAPLAALDILPEAMLAKRAKSALTGEAAEWLTDRTLKESLGAVGRETLKGAATEGLTEGLQEGGQYFGTRAIAGTPMSLSEGLGRMGEATVAGALPGSVMGGVTAGIEDGMGRFRRRNITEGTMEPVGAVLAGAVTPPGPVEPDFTVEADEGPLSPVQPSPAAPAAPPRPGNVPEAPAARGKKPRTTTTNPVTTPDLATALEQQAAMADEQAAAMAPPPVAPMGPPVEDFQPDVEPTPDELAAVLGAAGEPMVEPPLPEQVPESDRSPVPEPAPPAPDVFDIDRYVAREEAAEAAYRRGEPTDQFHEERSADYDARQALLAAMPDADLLALDVEMTARIEPMERGPARDSAIGLVDFVHEEMDKRGMPTPDDRFWYPKPAPTPAAKPKKAKKGVQPAPSLSEGLAQAADSTPAPQASTPQVRHEVGSTVRDSKGKAWVVKRVNDDGSMSLMPEQYSGVPIGQSVRAEDTGTFTAEAPKAAPSAPPVNASGQMVLPNNEIIQFPSGRWGFAGNVSMDLYYTQEDGSPLTPEQVRGIRHSGPGFVRGIKRVSFDSREAAEAALAARSGTSPAGAPAPAAGSVQDDSGRREPRDQGGRGGVSGDEAAPVAVSGLVPDGGRPNASTRRGGAGTAPVVAGQAEPGARPDDGNGAPQAENPGSTKKPKAPLSRVEQLVSESSDRAYIERELARHEEALEAGLSTKEETAIARAVVRAAIRRLRELDATEKADADRVLPAENSEQPAATPAGRTDRDVGAAVAADDVGAATGAVPRDADAAAEERGGVETGDRGGADALDAARHGEAGGTAAVESGGRPGVARPAGESSPRDGVRDAAGGVRKPKRPAVSPDVPSADAQMAPDAQGSTAADRHVVGENYRITDADPIGVGGQKGKADANMAAIRVLKQIEDEGRPATRAEQAVLVRYVGWGGIPQIFRDLTTGKVRAEWRTRVEELEALLTPDELAAARASTTNAHYTAPAVIKAMFGALEHLGFTGGRVLEPALGVGHFIGLTPDGMAGAVTWHGTELDSLSGRIAKQLYPRADIRVQGFEQMRVPDEFFDAAIGNPPFGSTQLADPRYDKHKLLIHDYFFAKSLDVLRPGGVLLYITSHGTMDKAAAKARRYIAERADLLGAVRLPSSAFEKNAMTSVTTDVLVFQKRAEGAAPAGESFAALGTHTNSRGETVEINEYFVRHPEMMLGIMSNNGTMRRGGNTELTLEPQPGLDLETALPAAFAKLPANVWSARPASTNATAPITQAADLAPSDALPETFAVRDGVLVQSRDGVWAPAGFKDAATTKRVTALVALRESVNTILGTQQQGASDAEIDAAIAAGRKRYTAFTREYGPILKTVRTVTKRIKKDGTPVITERRPNLANFVDDPLWYRVLTLEAYDAESNTAKPSQLLEGPVMGVQTLPDRFDNAIDALRAVMTTRGMVDVPWMAQRTDLTEAQVVEQLRGRIFENPQTGRYETAAKYLSGNVREKLAIAQAALDERPELKGNVAALKDALPKDILPTDISASLGAAWIPADTIKAFIGHLFPYHGGLQNVRINSLGGTNYSVTLPSAMEYAEESRTKWGTDDMRFSKLLEATLNQKTPVIRKPDGDGGTYLDLKATELAKARQTQLRDEWARWLMADDARADALSRLYNDRFNVWAPAVFDGSDLQFPGAVSYYKGKPFQLKPHQKNAVARYLENGNLYLGHVVGAGKTFTAAAIAIEARRLGLAKKPMIVTPNHMLAQWTTEFLAMYPTAKLLVADAEQFAVSERGAFVAKAASQEWDAIIIKSTAFFKLPVSRERQESLIEEEVNMLLEAIAEMKKNDAKGNRNGIKELEARIKALRVKLKRLAAEERKDEAFTFEETGTDLLIVDEAHEYKNLFLISGIQNLSIRGSDRAYDMYLKTRVLHEVNPGRGLVFMSGTPISNSFGELFTLQRYLQPQILESLGITRFDAWVATFAQPTTSQEKTATGKYKPKTRYRKFQNVPELRGMYSQVLDVKTQEHLQLPRPALIGGQPEVVVAPGSEALARYVKRLAQRAEMLKPGKPQKGADNFLSITNDGRIAGLDVRLVDRHAPDDPSSKVNLAVERIAELYKESTPYKGVQLVFLDLSTPGSELTEAAANRGGQLINIYDDMRAKLIKAGVPADEIGFAQEHKEDEQKAKFFADLKVGRKRIAFTSTQLMGAGTNVQDRLVALHRLDVPWKPSDLEQSEGRILRQGNLLYNDGLISGIRILRYVTRGSYDEQIWGMVLGKQRMVASVLSGDSTARTIEDADEVTLSYQQAMAAATDNPLFLEKIELDMKIASLEMLASAHATEQRGMRERRGASQRELAQATTQREAVQRDLARREDTAGTAFALRVGDRTYEKRADAAKALHNVVSLLRKAPMRLAETTHDRVGQFAGFPVEVEVFRQTEEITRVWLVLAGEERYASELASDQTEAGMLASLEHIAKHIDKRLAYVEQTIEENTQRLRQLDTSIGAPFNQRDELAAAKERRTAVEEELAKEPPKPEAPTTEATDEDSDDTDDDIIEEDDGAEEDDGTEERAAYTDPIAALIGETLRQIKKTLADRTTATEPLFRSNFAEVEARLQEGERGLPTLPWKDKARVALANLRASFSRHFPALETTKDGVHVLAHELLLGAERSGNWAKAMAADQLVTVVKRLSKGDVQTMARKLALDDIMKDIEAGLYDEGTVPFYGLDADGTRLPLAEVRARVEADLATANAAIQSAPAVAAATTRRGEIAQALTQRLVAIDALPASVLDDDRYFHRQVLSYAQARLTEQMAHPTGVGSPREVRNRTRGFQRRRVGGGEFNLAYQESEFEWIANAYQVIALHDILAAMKQAADITPSLKAQANAVNLQAFYDRVLPEGVTRADFALNPQADPLLPFRSRIARATQTIVKLIARGELTVAPVYQDMVAQWLEAEENGDRFSHPMYWSFLSSLVASEQGEATVAAASIYKAIHERKALIENTLGRDFIDPKNPEDLLELAPEGYRLWQPEKGQIFYSALTIAEKAVIEGTVGTLEGEAFRRALVMGGMKPTWIIPTGIALTMDSLTPAKGPANAFDAVVTGEVKLWKQWTLLSPLRALKYNFNNAAGDFDASLLAPGVLRYVKGSARDLWQYMRQRQTGTATTRELQDAIRRGVVDQGQAAAEIPDVINLPGLEALANATPNAFNAAIAFYWKHARGLTTWRENVLRLAAYRYFQAELRAGRRPYGASNRARVDGLRSLDDRAALLARDLVGDYGNITVGGETVRDRVIPFYSWLEINAKRYVNYFRNIPYQDDGAVGAAGRGAAAVAAKLGLKGLATGAGLTARFAVGAGAAAAFLVLIAAWNAFMFPEEWEEMRRTGREGQLILGHFDDGTIRSIRVEGAFADFLGWVGMKDIAADIRDVADGKMGYGDLLKDAAKAPVARLLNGLEPTTKSLYQFFTGKSLYPDPFNPRITRDPLGDPYGVFFDQWSIGWAYRQIVAPAFGSPKVPSRPGNPLLGLLLYQTDAGELAYQNARSQAIEWREKQGKEQGAGDPTARSNALYWFKKASQWGEDEAAQQWLQRYYQLGGTPKDVGQAMKRAHPLGVLAQKDQRAFLLSRSKAELEQIDRATDWYRRVMLSEGANAVRGTVRPAPATQSPSWIDRYRTQLQKPAQR